MMCIHWETCCYRSCGKHAWPLVKMRGLLRLASMQASGHPGNLYWSRWNPFVWLLMLYLTGLQTSANIESFFLCWGNVSILYWFHVKSNHTHQYHHNSNYNSMSRFGAKRHVGRLLTALSSQTMHAFSDQSLIRKCSWSPRSSGWILVGYQYLHCPNFHICDVQMMTLQHCLLVLSMETVSSILSNSPKCWHAEMLSQVARTWATRLSMDWGRWSWNFKIWRWVKLQAYLDVVYW